MPARIRRSLPAHPDLEQQRTLAKELLRAYRARDPEAMGRVHAELPDKPSIVLADAQYVLAREYGFASWNELRAHIESVRSEVHPPLDRMRSALSKRDAAAVRRLLEAHPELRALVDEPIFPFDSPALVHVAGQDDPDLIDVLLDFGADPNRRSGWWAGGFHPLHAARGAVAERLMAAGAVPDACAAANLDRADLLARMLDENPGRVNERGGDGQTPLHFARSRAVVDLLLDAGADPDARDVDHRATPAQWMLERTRGAGRYELARYLVERGATPDIFLAAALGLTGRLRELVEADPSVLELRTHQGPYGEFPPSSFHIYTWTIGQNRSPLEVAEQFEQTAAADVLRAFATPRQRFLAACAGGNANDAHALLGDHPGLRHELRSEDQRVLADAAWAGRSAAVELMLELGLDPAVPGPGTGTALHCAAWVGAADCVSAVLGDPRGRALIAARDAAHGSTPLGWCRHGSQHCGNPRADHATVARLLLEAGAQADPGEASAAVRAVIDRWRRG